MIDTTPAETPPPLIQGLWIGPLSNMEKLCMASFQHHGHAFHLHVYDEPVGVPAGVTVRDAAEVLPRERIFKSKGLDTMSTFSNLFRYKLLFEQGGYWVDMDTICLRQFPSEAGLVYATERLRGKPGEAGAAPGIIHAPPGLPLIGRCYEEAASRDSASLAWGEIGPTLFTRMVIESGMQHCAAEPWRFCPLDWWDWRLAIEPYVHVPGMELAHAVHLWNEMWRRSGIDKNGTFPADSLYAWLQRKYLK